MRSNLSGAIAFIVMLALAVCLIQIQANDPSPPRYRFNVIFINGCESKILRDINGTCESSTSGTSTFHLSDLWQKYTRMVRIPDHGRTILHCTVTRVVRYKESSFIAFDQERDRGDHRCGSTGECWYKITEVGIYWSNHNGSWTKIINW
ncbi:hypothetical protein M5689_025327 [Euphorbia peplus]|nr:hypothetical protein M5689_025327 [Euphorbia peplus]